MLSVNTDHHAPVLSVAPSVLGLGETNVDADSETVIDTLSVFQLAVLTVTL